MPRQPHKPTPQRAATTDWNAIAPWYDQLVGDEGSDYHRHVVLPGAVRLLQPQAGQRMLDVACGQGVLCRILNQLHVEVTGIDAAPDLIESARQRGPDTIRYQVADARELNFLPADHFHAAACILAIQNIHPIAPVFEGIARALAAGGRFLIVMMHPCFRSPRQTSWGWDEAQKIQYRRVDGYLMPRKSPIVTHPGKKTGQYSWTFHKPLEAYIRELVKAGLLIEALQEWPGHKVSTSGPRAAAENTARKEIPLFLAISAVKKG